MERSLLDERAKTSMEGRMVATLAAFHHGRREEKIWHPHCNV
jgi:hypothetical protein